MGGRDCPTAAESWTRQPPLQRDSEEVSVPEGTACVRALSPSVVGVWSEETVCESRRESLPGSGWCILCFDFTFFGLES